MNLLTAILTASNFSQTRIRVNELRRMYEMNEWNEVVSVNLLRAARLRQSILQKAFAGELV